MLVFLSPSLSSLYAWAETVLAGPIKTLNHLNPRGIRQITSLCWNYEHVPKKQSYFSDKTMRSRWGVSIFPDLTVEILSCGTSVWPLDAPLRVPGIVTSGWKYGGLGDRLCRRILVDFIFSVSTRAKKQQRKYGEGVFPWAGEEGLGVSRQTLPSSAEFISLIEGIGL